MRKATHLGTCQACGRMQMLPGGLLADHGYELRHGWRRGSCMGTGHKPYEESTDLIERCIASALDSAAKKDARASEIEAQPLGDLTCHRKVYHSELSSRTRGSVYLWEEGRIEGEGFAAVFVWGETGGRPGKRETLHAGHVKAAVYARELRKQHAASIRASADRSRQYADRQRERIANWQPMPLTPRPEK